jgi:hypothetical protein
MGAPRRCPARRHRENARGYAGPGRAAAPAGPARLERPVSHPGIPAAEKRCGRPGLVAEVITGLVAGVPLEDRLPAGQYLIGVNPPGPPPGVDEVAAGSRLSIDPYPFPFGLDFHPPGRPVGCDCLAPLAPPHVCAVASFHLVNQLQLHPACLSAWISAHLSIVTVYLIVGSAAQRPAGRYQRPVRRVSPVSAAARMMTWPQNLLVFVDPMADLVAPVVRHQRRPARSAG